VVDCKFKSGAKLEFIPINARRLMAFGERLLAYDCQPIQNRRDLKVFE
jgi:hypothetical protein